MKEADLFLRKDRFINEKKNILEFQNKDIFLPKNEFFNLKQFENRAKVQPPKEQKGSEVDAQYLLQFLDVEPQRDANGTLRYLVTGGVAVDLYTGFTRYHKDLDLVIMDLGEQARSTRTDDVTPQKYWADMSFDSAFLQETVLTVGLVHKDTQELLNQVEVVHPAVLLVQKLSNCWGRQPRYQDLDDVEALRKLWIEYEGADESWDPIIDQALASLPAAEVERTKGRLDRTTQAVQLARFTKIY